MDNCWACTSLLECFETFRGELEAGETLQDWIVRQGAFSQEIAWLITMAKWRWDEKRGRLCPPLIPVREIVREDNKVKVFDVTEHEILKRHLEAIGGKVKTFDDPDKGRVVFLPGHEFTEAEIRRALDYSTVVKIGRTEVSTEKAWGQFRWRGGKQNKQKFLALKPQPGRGMFELTLVHISRTGTKKTTLVA